MRIPIKPFPDYKWRWAELTPSEGLNNPVRLIGVLRTLYKHQGEPKSTEAIHEELEKIERETNSLTGERITLARTGERNLLRNSDRYWKALGLLDASSRTILLTPLGEKVAEGRITQDEFAVTVLQTLILPNRSIESNVSDWENAKLEIKPLQLILQILQTLQQSLGDAQAYITPEELQKVVIPIAGDKGTMEDYCSALQKYRLGMLDISAFPDCAPGANDKRMIREFLLFLSHYGFCHVQQGSTNANTKYFLQTTYNINEFAALEGSLQVVPGYVADLQVIEKTPVILEAQRRKKSREILERPQQAKFRRDVLKKIRQYMFADRRKAFYCPRSLSHYWS
jgi:hypothetical protein